MAAASGSGWRSGRRSNWTRSPARRGWSWKAAPAISIVTGTRRREAEPSRGASPRPGPRGGGTGPGPAGARPAPRKSRADQVWVVAPAPRRRRDELRRRRRSFRCRPRVPPSLRLLQCRSVPLRARPVGCLCRPGERGVLPAVAARRPPGPHVALYGRGDPRGSRRTLHLGTGPPQERGAERPLYAENRIHAPERPPRGIVHLVAPVRSRPTSWTGARSRPRWLR